MRDGLLLNGCRLRVALFSEGLEQWGDEVEVAKYRGACLSHKCDIRCRAEAARCPIKTSGGFQHSLGRSHHKGLNLIEDVDVMPPVVRLHVFLAKRLHRFDESDGLLLVSG